MIGRCPSTRRDVIAFCVVPVAAILIGSLIMLASGCSKNSKYYKTGKVISVKPLVGRDDGLFSSDNLFTEIKLEDGTVMYFKNSTMTPITVGQYYGFKHDSFGRLCVDKLVKE